MLRLDVKIRDSFLQLQGVYIAVVGEHLKRNGVKVLDELIDLKVKVDYKKKVFRIKDSGLGASISYESLLKRDKNYDSDYDIFEYYCQYHKVDEILLPSYFGYDVLGMLGYFKKLEFTMEDGFIAEVDNYVSVDSYRTNYLIPITSKLEGIVLGSLKFDTIRTTGNLRALCRTFKTSFSIESKIYGGTFRQHNKKCRLTRKQQDLRDSIMMLVNDRLSNAVCLFNYIKTDTSSGLYGSRLVSRTVKDKNSGKFGYIVTLIDGGK